MRRSFSYGDAVKLLGGLHRVDRTRLLEAAHGILVMTSFFEAIDDVGPPFKIKIGKGEQLTLAGAGRPGSKRRSDLVRALLGTATPLPSAEQPPDVIVREVSFSTGPWSMSSSTSSVASIGMDDYTAGMGDYMAR